ncbi:MAG: hypothetical protein LZF86_110954 [Nitrospira sp.]|nr:MAG: hypothetical protein LZF86_110954 [Nitrospira sp.]
MGHFICLLELVSEEKEGLSSLCLVRRGSLSP